jgi:hypothetical protein
MALSPPLAWKGKGMGWHDLGILTWPQVGSSFWPTQQALTAKLKAHQRAVLTAKTGWLLFLAERGSLPWSVNEHNSS